MELFLKALCMRILQGLKYITIYFSFCLLHGCNAKSFGLLMKCSLGKVNLGLILIDNLEIQSCYTKTFINQKMGITFCVLYTVM